MPADDAAPTDEPTGYDRLAARAEELTGTASPWGDSPFQRHHSWPATERLLPDEGTLARARVLLAGCGRGDHVDWFRERGATVVGLDASARALAAARERFRGDDRVAFARADLDAGLPVTGPFDLVCSHLVFGHLREWRPPLRACRRVLDPAGRLVLTTVHPAYLRAAVREATDGVRVDECTAVTREWAGAEVTVHYRPTSEALQAVLDAGFRLDEMVEPAPEPAYEAVEPERYRAALATPEVLCLRARPETP